MIVAHSPAIVQRTPFSFQTFSPNALARWLMDEHTFTEQLPLANELFRLHLDGMTITIFRLGLILCEGRNASAAVLLLSDLCVEECDAV